MVSARIRILPVLAASLFLAAVAYHSLVSGDDPYRCRAVLETGQWIDHPDAHGNRLPFKHWQPDGCLFHKYTSADIRQCMEGRSFLFSGDSLTQEVVYGLGRLLDRAQANQDQQERYRSDQVVGVKSTYLYRGLPLMYYLNPYLETTSDPQWDPLVEQLELFWEEQANHVFIKDQIGPALVILGAGGQFTNVGDHETKWREKYAANLLNVSEIVSERANFITEPMDPIDGVGNQVFFAPPSLPAYMGMNRTEAKMKSLHREEITKLQEWLLQASDTLNFPLTWAIPKLSIGQNKTIADPAGTGYHAIEIVAETKANIYLNLRCNAKLDRQNGYPYSRTCCTDYGSKPLVQLLLVFLGLIYLVACVACDTWDLLAGRSISRWQVLNMETGSFVMALLMCYYADRTQMMAKSDKLWSHADFSILCIPFIATAVVTIRKSQSPLPKCDVLDADIDQPFLSREQTDEWKGWSQCVIIVYQWTAAERSPTLYILVRLLVASYLFQIGYGHTTFFLRRKDYSFKRVASILLRLNLLTCSLAYVMNTEYMFYYFSPAASFWFLVVYTTMAMGHQRLNDDAQWIVAKICISAVIVALVVLVSPLTRWVFALLQILFNIQWSVQDWEYGVSLDLIIVYIGMLAAVANYATKKALNLALRCSMALVAVMVLWGYGHTCSVKISSVVAYRIWHPYTSFVPILAFVAIRNVASPLRNYTSKAMTWLGRCSLEAYVLQFHILLAGDTKGVLLIGAFKGDGSLLDRWRSLVIIVPIFLWVSSMTATATVKLIKAILNTESHPDLGDGIQLSDIVDKDGNNNPVDGGASTDKEDEPFLDVPKSASLHYPRTSLSRNTRRVSPTKSILCVPARFVMILLFMWLLNLLSPSLRGHPIPDGPTSNTLPVPTALHQSPNVQPGLLSQHHPLSVDRS
ncbi:CAS1 domain-containing protein [Dactylonectria estremocensis]|uniref:CAS1 domain-containing protein n=1 Tax=Dactylonectria estremocensis TaxID=1079267 RepID=A0A9P9J5C4_9HYPO|nr:CAS1 domain-containing protein [Dactylonectria estremocensis]